MRFLAKTFHGLESVLADELKSLGATNLEQGKRCVHFYGDKQILYRANYALRTALCVLKPIASFHVYNSEDLYQKTHRLNWLDYLTLGQTICVSSSVRSSCFPHSKFAALKVKDAIVDRIRKEKGVRPDVDRLAPDVKINVHIIQTHCTLSLDSSGVSLHKRAYRTDQHKAPVNEVLAAGLVRHSGWMGGEDFLDPMCGSGTLLIEAAMLVSKTPAQVLRKKFAFQNWPDYDEGLFEKIIQKEKAKIKSCTVGILGRDTDQKALKMAYKSLDLLNLKEIAYLEEGDFFLKKNEHSSPRFLLFNPPYNQRLFVDLPVFYKAIGDTLKRNYTNAQAWLFSREKTALKNIGLKPSQRIALFNGKIPCELIKYELYEGRKKRGDHTRA